MASSADAAAPPGDALFHVRFKGLLTFAIMMAMMMQILDTTIANVALPHMQTSLGATIDSISWVLTSYIVATAVAIPITGWLSDRIGSRQLFLAALAMFIITSMLCGIATSLEEMVAFRILQGIAAAFIGPLSQTAMLDINPQHKHGSAMALWSMGAVVGPIIGPLIGGYLTEYYNWRWVFFVNLPFGVGVFTLLYFLLPGRQIKRRGFDLFGFSMFALGLASLQLVLDRGQTLDWLDSRQIWIGIGTCIIGLWIFTIHMLTGRGQRIITPSIFRDVNLTGSVIFMFIAGTLVFSTMTLIAPMVQSVMGHPVISAGVILAPRGVGVILAMILTARLMKLIDARVLLAIGWAISAWTCYLMTGWAPDMDSWPIISVGILQGVGIGVVLVPLNTLAFATLSLDQRPEAAAMMNLSRNFGGSVGISITATIVARTLQISHSEIGANMTVATVQSLDLSRIGLPPEIALRLMDAEINRQAVMIGYLDSFWLVMWCCIAAIPATLFLKPLPRSALEEGDAALAE